MKLIHNNKAGFTLFEIMVVLVIIGIMAALIVPNIMNRPEQARVTIAKTDLHAVANALELYKLDHYAYPTTEEGLQALVNKPEQGKGSSYLKKLPVDPWGNPYQYACPGKHGEYDLYSWGAQGKKDKTASVISEWDL